MDVAEVLNFVEAMAAGGAFVRLVVSMMCCVCLIQDAVSEAQAEIERRCKQ
jgi:hypothetical protein